MNVSVLQDNLVRALDIVSHSVNGKSTLPILSNVLLKTDNGQIMIATTDLDMSTIVYCGGRVELDGAITIPHKQFEALIATLSNERVDLVVDNAKIQLNLTSGASKAMFKGIDALDFPVFPELAEGAEGVKVDSDKFFTALNQIFHAASREYSRPILHGINIQVRNNLMIIAAADGYRLAEARIEVESNHRAWNVTIDTDMLKRLIKVHKAALGKASEPIVIFRDEDSDRIHFVSGECLNGSYHVITDVIDGTFPDLSVIVDPLAENATVCIDSIALRTHCKRASVYSKESNDTLRLVLDAEKQVIYVRASSSETGEYEGVIDARITGEMAEPSYVLAGGLGNNPTLDIPNKNSFAINRAYLDEALATLQGDIACIGFDHKDKPCIIRPESADQLRLVIMPMHIGR